MRSREPVFNLPPVIAWLGAGLIGVQLLRLLLPPIAEDWMILAFSFIPLRYGVAAGELPGGALGQVWTPVSYAFLHGDFLHLAVNLVWTAAFGSALARRFGAARFLLLSVIAAAAGAAAHYMAYPADPYPMVGASAAISGMTAATARFAFAPGGPLAGGEGRPSAYVLPAPNLMDTLRNPRAVMFLIIWSAVNLVFGISGSVAPGVAANIAWQAHIGGFLAGLACFASFDPIGPRPPGGKRAVT